MDITGSDLAHCKAASCVCVCIQNKKHKFNRKEQLLVFSGNEVFVYLIGLDQCFSTSGTHITHGNSRSTCRTPRLPLPGSKASNAVWQAAVEGSGWWAEIQRMLFTCLKKWPHICPEPLNDVCSVWPLNPKVTGDDIIAINFWWYFQQMDYAELYRRGQTLRNARLDS